MANILFITADQWRADAVSASGLTPVRTPHIDRIAAEGARFTRHFANAAPCSPARACLYTGLYQMTNRVQRNGTPLDHRHRTLAQVLRGCGYDPTLFGYTDIGADPDIHLPGDPWLRTYEGILPGMSVRVWLPEEPGPWISWLRARGHDIPSDWFDMFLPSDGKPARWGKPPRYSAEETEAAFLVGEFERWLFEQRRPWCAHISFLAPHPPFTVPEPYASMYDPDDGPAPAIAGDWRSVASSHPFLDKTLGLVGPNQKMLSSAGPIDQADERAMREVRATYWGMVSEIDAQIGRLRAMLEAAGAWDDTIVVLTGDHGEQLGDHHLWGKLGFYDGSYRVPLVIRAPGMPGGVTIDRFTEAVDVMPTLVDLVGADVPGHLDGRSLVPFLAGEAPPDWREAAHVEFDIRNVASGRVAKALGLDGRSAGLAVHREAGWAYVHFAGLPPLLYDLTNDPDQHVNLAADPAYAAVRLEMAEKLLSWRAGHLDRRFNDVMLE